MTTSEYVEICNLEIADKLKKISLEDYLLFSYLSSD